MIEGIYSLIKRFARAWGSPVAMPRRSTCSFRVQGLGFQGLGFRALVPPGRPSRPLRINEHKEGGLPESRCHIVGCLLDEFFCICT